MSKKLLVKYLSGSCSELEIIQVQQWLAVSAQNREKFDRLRLIWELSSSKSDNDISGWDVESALNNVNARIESYKPIIKLNPPKQSSFIHFSRLAAAAIAILMMASFFTYYIMNVNSKAEIITVAVNDGKSQMIELPDGSKVYLNADARISYPESFTADARLIDFEGEAFFEVSPDVNKPFIINATNIGVEVVGTSFNLKANSITKEYQLDLKTGKVLFYSLNPQTKSRIEQIILFPGERGAYSSSTYSLCKVKNNNENYLAWHTGILEFDNSSLTEVVKALQDTYKVDISLDPSLGELKLTARFQGQKIESVLETLRIIFGCQIDNENSIISIKKVSAAS